MELLFWTFFHGVQAVAHEPFVKCLQEVDGRAPWKLAEFQKHIIKVSLLKCKDLFSKGVFGKKV